MSRACALLMVLTATVLGARPGWGDAPAPSAWNTETVTKTAGQPDGYVQFQNRCAICHGHGPAHPGTRALAAKYKGALPAALEDRKDLTADLITYTVRHGVTVMPPVRKTELSDSDLQAIVGYLMKSH